jgi:hypothetical protein
VTTAMQKDNAEYWCCDLPNGARERVTVFIRDPLDRTSRAEQTSQIFCFLGSLKFIRHVRFVPILLQKDFSHPDAQH